MVRWKRNKEAGGEEERSRSEEKPGWGSHTVTAGVGEIGVSEVWREREWRLLSFCGNSVGSGGWHF